MALPSFSFSTLYADLLHPEFFHFFIEETALHLQAAGGLGHAAAAALQGLPDQGHLITADLFLQRQGGVRAGGASGGGAALRTAGSHPMRTGGAVIPAVGLIGSLIRNLSGSPAAPL